MHTTPDTDAAAAPRLLAPWPGPYGGLPPFDLATPDAIDAAYRQAIALRRAELRAIADNPAPPTFANTLEALEDSGRALRRVETLLRTVSATCTSDSMRAVERAVAPLGPQLDDEIAHDEALFARIKALHLLRGPNAAGLDAEQRRLVDVVHDAMRRRGAGLPAAARQRLSAINGSIATLIARFNQNLLGDQEALATFITSADELAGLPDALCETLRAAAAARGRPGAWCVPNGRPTVWPVLTLAAHRPLRERVWRLWMQRGDLHGERDNKPVIAEILALRGEKGRLLGFDDFAQFATAERMAGTPDAALALLHRVWQRVIGPSQALLADLQALADGERDGERDGEQEGEGAAIRIAPWDRLFYSEKLRRQRFDLDADAVKPYLPLEGVLQAMLWAAGRVHGLQFTEVQDAPVLAPGIRVFALARDGRAAGVLYVDLLQRSGKMPSSWSSEYRAAESFNGAVLPIASINSNVPLPADGSLPLVTWEVANVLFHEMGHALHMLCSRARYPSLGPLAVPWDFIELPSLLNERWLRDPELLHRFARHHATGEPMPAALVDKIARAERFGRLFSLNLDYLAPAIVDLRLHALADGRHIDAVALEDATLSALGMPPAWDVIMRLPNSHHAFSDKYAAGVYVYLWADVMAADVAEVFAQAPGGLWDAAVAQRWRDSIATVGATVPAEQAFRNFMGREPDPAALLRCYGLADAE